MADSYKAELKDDKNGHTINPLVFQSLTLTTNLLFPEEGYFCFLLYLTWLEIWNFTPLKKKA